MDKFTKGQMVIPKSRYKFPMMVGQLTINSVDPKFCTPLYACTDRKNTKYEFWEYEIETQFQHDKRSGLLSR